LSDFGVNDTTYRVRTHLGHILKAGDNVLGYDLVTAVSDQEELRKVLDNSPDMILIRKSYENDGEKAKKKRNRRRKQSSTASVKPTHDDILADDLVAEDVEDLQKVLDETDVRNGKSDENGHLDFEEEDEDDFDDNDDDIDMKALDGMDLMDEEHNNSRNHETQINIALKGDVNIQS
jgi:nonsense-mediated mRNA decay protein 3